MEPHYVIPLNLGGLSVKENKIMLDPYDHKELHNIQDLPERLITEYHQKINHIITPNNYVLDLRRDIWFRFFETAIFSPYFYDQVNSLVKQVKRQRKVN